jgi:hypothetical protein
MASKNQPIEQIQELRREHTGGDEPLLETDASVCGMGRNGRTPYVSPSREGADVAGVEIGDEVRVEIFESAILIKTDGTHE